jgi:hypothetical protein
VGSLILNFEFVLHRYHLIFQGCHFRQAALMAFCFIETGGQEGFG